MSSNTSIGKGKKGSKYWMQAYINSNLQDELNNAIGCNLEWLSPLEEENYCEYQLSQDKICKVLNITKEKKKDFFAFWPNRQPQWDGIALNEDKSILYLVEAKAHIAELKSKMTSKNEKNIELITNTMKDVFSEHYPNGNFRMWTSVYYQLGNRLAFLHKMNNLSELTGIKAKLVLLNFVDDEKYKPTDENKWNEHYKEILQEMLGITKAPEDVIIINLSVKGREWK